MDSPEIIYRPVSELKPNPRNARTHSKKQIAQIAASMQTFGFINPIVTDSNNLILAGHGRWEAAKQIGLESAPVVLLDHLTDALKRAYALADNRIAQNAGWDEDMLRVELGDLAAFNLDFDLEVTGFATAEIDFLIDGVPAKLDPADKVPELAIEAVSRAGDLWCLGDHRAICGNALDAAVHSAVLEAEKARMVFADVPYNVPIDGHAGGNGAVKHREFAMASGEMSDAEFENFLRTIFAHCANVSRDGAIHFICMDWRHAGEVTRAAAGIYSELKNICVWNKTNAGMGSFYRSKHEFIFVYKVGIAQHLNTIELGKTGRYRSNIWDYAGISAWGPGRDADLAMHPTVKPTAMVIDAIKDCSRRGDIILDPCAGSGTTLLAAEKSGRQARVIEIDPLYVDTIIRRWQTFTGKTATLQGVPFHEVSGARLAPTES